MVEFSSFASVSGTLCLQPPPAGMSKCLCPLQGCTLKFLSAQGGIRQDFGGRLLSTVCDAGPGNKLVGRFHYCTKGHCR